MNWNSGQHLVCELYEDHFSQRILSISHFKLIVRQKKREKNKAASN